MAGGEGTLAITHVLWELSSRDIDFVSCKKFYGKYLNYHPRVSKYNIYPFAGEFWKSRRPCHVAFFSDLCVLELYVL
jgi:hypothetical protein